MDHFDLSRGDSEIDLESGGATSEEDGDEYQKVLDRSWNEFSGQESVDASANSTQDFGSFDKASSNETFVNDWESVPGNFGEEVTNVVEKRTVEEKLKKAKSKWPPKPPRPPGGPSLHVSDMKLVKEISELAMLKRKRAERRKALDRMRKEKKPSSKSTNLIAMVITALFFFVIIFQGFLGSHV